MSISILELAIIITENFCLIEVRAMVVAVQQPLAECTAIFTVCIIEHPHLPVQ